jgi:benzoylformate decarboxylase
VFVESRRDMERWAFSSDHPCFAGLFEPGGSAATHADLLFLAGTPTPLEFSAEVPILPPGVPVVHLSEDAAEPGRRVPVAIGLAGDTELALAELASLLDGVVAESRSHLEEVRAAHASQLQGWRSDIPAEGEGEDFSAAVAMRTLAEHLGGSGILVLDGVTSTLPLLRFIERPHRDTLFATASGSLGWAMGAAPGIALARGERVTAVVGDGVLQFGVPAFWTVRHYNIPVTYVVVNNGKYQAMVSGLRRMNGLAHAKRVYPMTDISGVDIAGLAESFGIPATRVTSAADLALAVDADLARTAHDGPHLIEIKVNDVLWP